MPKIKYKGAHDSYTVADITFKKGEAIELADDQVAKIKANGVGSKLFAKGDLMVDKATAKPVVSTESTPALKSNNKADVKAKADK